MKEEAERVEEQNRALQDELNHVRSRLSSVERSGAEGKHAEDEASTRVRTLESDLREAKEEGERRVAETVQFQQMKRLMQSQAQNIKDLRRRLAKYEPVDAKNEEN